MARDRRVISRAATTKRPGPSGSDRWGGCPPSLFLVLFFCFIVYPYAIIGVMIDVEMATTITVKMGFDTTAKIVYIIVKSYLGE